MNFYNQVANVLRDIDKNKISFKSAIYNYTSYDGDRNFKKIYKLVVEVLRCKKILKEIIENFFQFEDINNLECFMVLCYERFFSDIRSKKKIGGKLMRMLKEKENEIKNYIKENYNSDDYKNNSESDLIYFRVNKQKKNNTFEDILKKDESNFISTDDLIDGLYSVSKSNNEMVKKIFELKNSSEIIMQTKSSCLPAYILKLIHNKRIKNEFIDRYDVMDTCSAPGNKTLQLSEYFHDKQTKILAFEIDSRRFEIMKQNVEKNNFNKNIALINQDFLLTDPFDPKYANVKYILSDPSCSGSGTLNNSLVDDNNGKDNSLNNTLSSMCCLDIAGSNEEKEKIERLTKLAKFQAKILDHCMKFPSVKYISYSTCSIFMTENEFVVSKVLKRNKDFRLFNIFELDGFKGDNDIMDFHKGLTNKTEATLRSCRLCHKIDGFYVSIFERVNI